MHGDNNKEFAKSIRNAFELMQTKNDLLDILNRAKKNLYGERAIPFELRQLTYYANPKISGKRYTSFEILKKNGEHRTINAPVNGLKALQKALSLVLQIIYKPHNAATGFISGRSIVDNASPHTGKKFLYNLDLKDFFTSVDQARVWKCLQLRPFNLTEKASGDSKDNRPKNNKLELANIIAGICCTGIVVERKNEADEWVKIEKNVLPQGAPTSPVITNIVCQRLDYLLTGVAKRFGLQYSRYADDITFSSNHYVYGKNSNFITEIKRIITEQHFYIKESKTRLQRNGYRQEVTGLIVNEKVNVSKVYIKQLRMWLYYWERYGYDKMNGYFLPSYLKEKKHLYTNRQPNLNHVISGKLDYLKMVKGQNNELYIKLKKRFLELTNTPAIVHEIVTNDDKTTFIKRGEESNNRLSLPEYIDPRNTARFLHAYNQNPILKSTCHEIDEEMIDNIKREIQSDTYLFSGHLKAIREHYEELRKKYDKVNKGIKGKIGEYLNNYIKEKEKKGWTANKILLTWSSKELDNWSKEHPGKCPNPSSTLGYPPFEIQPIIIQKEDKVLNTFNDVVLYFKSQIHFRLDNSLYDLIDGINDKISEPVVFNLQNCRKNIEFFTDVEKVGQAYKSIIRMCMTHNKELTPRFEISLNENTTAKEGTSIVFSIHHLNSTFGKTAHATIERYGSEITNIINTKINGLCDFQLIADFANDEYAEISLWPRKGDINTIQQFKGVKFRLIFYRLS